MLSDLRFRLRALLRRSAVDAELDAELRDHLGHLIAKHEAHGCSREEAVRLARLEFGGLDQIKDDCRDARGIGVIDATAQDVRYAARVLGRDTVFTAIAALTLAVGIGASTTIFSVVDAVLLKPLPFAQAERVVFPWRLPADGFDLGFDIFPWHRVEFLTFARQTRTFARLGAFEGASFNLTGDGDPARVDGARVSAAFFAALGVEPRVGRTFSEQADRPGGPRETVISDQLWRRRFGSDPAIVGRTVLLNGEAFTVVGIMPAGFAFPQSAGMPNVFPLPRESSIWVPLALPRGPAYRGEPSELAVVGRLARGVSLDAAQAELDQFAEQLDREIPRGRGWHRSRAVPITQQLAGGTRRALLLLLGAVGVLLLIACSNVANLLITRAIARAREFTLRAALGAGRGRLIRQLATEHLVLAGLGCAGGLAVASVGVAIVRTSGPASVPRLAGAQLDATAFLFAVALALACALLFSAAPVWTSTRHDLAAWLKDAGSRSVTSARGLRARSALLVAEVALALVLAIASGLLVRSFVRLARVDAGFNPDRALTFELTLPSASYATEERIVALYSDVLDRLRALPGVESAGIAETVPMGGAGEGTGLRIPDRPTTDDNARPFANYTIASPGYFAAVGTPVLQGRVFADTDTATSLPVAIVSAAMARKFWPGQNPIGRQVGVPIRPYDMTVVGVVADVKHVSLREEPAPEIYVPYTQKPWPSMQTMHVIVRTRTAPASITAAVRNAIREIDPHLPLARVAALETFVDEALAQPRFSVLLVGGFGIVSLLLACVGLYGAVSYSVASRTRELGVRVALGASPRRVFGLVLGQCVRITVLGIAIGLGIALLALRVMEGFLYGIEPTDPATFAALSALLLAVALLAGYVPARRAMRVDPLVAMRVE